MARKLKVFRTAVGFHDAYVAAPSQKAALEAWGSDANLFARGVAEIVTDPELMADPLAHPGKVIKRLRGSEAEHLAALGSSKTKRTAWSNGVKPTTGTKAPRKKPAPRPDRQPLEQAERRLVNAEREADAVATDFRAQERKLAEERRKAERAASDAVQKARGARDAARRKYDRALAAWRG